MAHYQARSDRIITERVILAPIHCFYKSKNDGELPMLGLDGVVASDLTDKISQNI